MIKLVIKNLKPAIPHRFIFICQRAHLDEYALSSKLTRWSPGCHIITIDGVTEGAACTVLKAKELIDNDYPLMIANSDQYVDVSVDTYLEAAQKSELSGLIMTMTANDSKWSYVGIKKNMVTRVVEKKVISDEATVGIYNFSKGSDFVSAANKMIQKNLRVNNEFYVAPTYNEMIEANKKIGIYNIGREGNGMYGLGIPADLESFLSTELCSKITTVDK
jgi:dTDP-glucose pyrophosphorylase